MKHLIPLKEFPLTEGYVRENRNVLLPVLEKHADFILRGLALITERVQTGKMYGGERQTEEAMQRRGIAEYTPNQIIDIALAEALYALIPMDQRAGVKPPLIEIR